MPLVILAQEIIAWDYPLWGKYQSEIYWFTVNNSNQPQGAWSILKSLKFGAGWWLDESEVEPEYGNEYHHINAFTSLKSFVV